MDKNKISEAIETFKEDVTFDIETSKASEETIRLFEKLARHCEAVFSEMQKVIEK